MRVLHFISKITTYGFVLCFLLSAIKYLLQLFLYVLNMQRIVIGIFYLDEIIAIFTSIMIIKKYIKISSPYEKYIVNDENFH